MSYTLAIADRLYSSWSLRGWLMFIKFDLPVKTRFAPMRTPAFAEMLSDFGLARTVPAMKSGDLVVRDSLAMAETLAERHPDAGLWPEDPAARGAARSMVAEMHAGFTALRGACPMNLRHAYADFAPSPEVLADVARIETLWQDAGRFAAGGPWLFGAYSLADVFFAPVAMRFATYGLGTETSRDYIAAHLTDPAFRRWRAMGFAENRVMESYDLDLPRLPWPGPAPLPASPVLDRTPVNAACPYSGDPVSPEALADIDGTVVGYCNTFCRDKSVADAEAWPQTMALRSRA